MSLFKYKFFSIFLFAFLFCGFFIVSSDAKANNLLQTYVSVILVCGDGHAEPLSGEVCDPGEPINDVPPDIGSTTCSSFNDIDGNPFTQGALGCLADCSDYNTSQCHTCGNGYKESVEQCDSFDFGGGSCISFGFQSGSLVCSSDCRVSTANCVAAMSEGGSLGRSSGGGSPGGSTGFLPGSTEKQETKIIIKGKAYTSSDVHILIDGKVLGLTKANANADFSFETTDIPSGVGSFGFWAEDVNKIKSTLLTLTFRVTSGAVTTISGVYLAPTISINKESVKPGEDVLFSGTTVPKSGVYVHIGPKEEIIKTATSSDSGKWELVFNTASLSDNFYPAKAFFQIDSPETPIKSGFSKSVGFQVGKAEGSTARPGADLNNDKRVNLTDFSILLYYWGTDNADIDQNKDGKVNLTDFSIMMFYWTG